MNKKSSKAEVIIPPEITDPPKEHEIRAAWILAHHFNTPVVFLEPSRAYKQHTPDILMLNIEWELKSPESIKKRKIWSSLSEASRQSSHIVLDSGRTKLSDTEVRKIIERRMAESNVTKRIIWITKDEQVLDFKK
jgi:hypothetical protein